jgi:3-hydroxyacyl-[acyl-carrier-protein] dehydratase
MVLIDEVLSCEPGGSIRAIKAISGCEPCYAGMPDGAPKRAYAYPASLVIESFGQAMALLWLASTESDSLDVDRVLMVAAARDCIVESRAFPGEVLEHVGRLDQVVAGTAFAVGETRVAGRRIARFGSLVAVVRPRDPSNSGPG